MCWGLAQSRRTVVPKPFAATLIHSHCNAKAFVVKMIIILQMVHVTVRTCCVNPVHSSHAHIRGHFGSWLDWINASPGRPRFAASCNCDPCGLLLRVHVCPATCHRDPLRSVAVVPVLAALQFGGLWLSIRHATVISRKVMEEFLNSVYATPPEKQVIDRAKTLFAAVGWHEKQQLVGVIDTDVEALCKQDTAIPVKVLMRAAARMANAAHSATLVPGGSSGSNVHAPTVCAPSEMFALQVQGVVGSDLSAATLAKLISAGTGEVDIAKKLQDAHMSKLPYHMQCERLVWKILDAENKAAESANRQAYAYVDLTAKEVLPLWLPQDAIGGQSVFGSDWCPSNGSATTLAELGKALQAAASQHKIFRSLPQWMGAFAKYAAVAIALRHMTTPRVLAYMNVIAKIHEEEQVTKGSSPLIAVLYDDVFRKMVARRAEAKDPELDFDAVFARTDMQILESCKARVGSVARALPGAMHNVGHEASSSLQGPAMADLAKHTAAAEGAARKAEAATRALAQAQTWYDNHDDDQAHSRKRQKHGMWQLQKIAASRDKQARKQDGNRVNQRNDRHGGGNDGGKGRRY